MVRSRPQHFNLFGLVAGFLAMSVLAAGMLNFLGANGLGKEPNFGPPIVFQENEKTVKAQFDDEVRIVLIPPRHCISSHPEESIEVLKAGERFVQIKPKRRTMVTFKKYRLSDPMCTSQSG